MDELSVELEKTFAKIIQSWRRPLPGDFPFLTIKSLCLIQQQIRLVGVGGDFQLKFLELGHYASFKRFESEIYYPKPDGVLSKKQ